MHDSEQELACSAALELAALALDAELDASQAAALAAHLECCASCRDIAQALEADLQRRAGLAPRPLPAEFFARVHAATAGAGGAALHSIVAQRAVRALPWLIAAASILVAFLARGGAPQVERVEVPGPVVVRELRVEVPAAPIPALSVRLVLDSRPLAAVLRSWSELTARQLERETELRRSELEHERAVLASACLERALLALARGIERSVELAVRVRAVLGETRAEPVPEVPRLAPMPERSRRVIAPVEILATARGTRFELSGERAAIVASLQALSHDERADVAALARAHLDAFGVSLRR